MRISALLLVTFAIRMTLRALLGSIALSFSAFAQESADVIVYGSTPGGFCAAIAAAREGASVILLEPTEHVGGLSTGGFDLISQTAGKPLRPEGDIRRFIGLHQRLGLGQFVGVPILSPSPGRYGGEVLHEDIEGLIFDIDEHNLTRQRPDSLELDLVGRAQCVEKRADLSRARLERDVRNRGRRQNGQAENQ